MPTARRAVGVCLLGWQIGAYSAVGAYLPPGGRWIQNRPHMDDFEDGRLAPQRCASEQPPGGRLLASRRNSGDNLICGMRFRHTKKSPISKSDTSYKSEAFCPHSSSVMKCLWAFHASFPPGEALAPCGRCRHEGATIISPTNSELRTKATGMLRRLCCAHYGMGAAAFKGLAGARVEMACL